MNIHLVVLMNNSYCLTLFIAGVLVLINNYTGDRLNFGIALERARVEGIKAEIVLNAEDCSVHTKDKTAGRRGLAGCVLLMKASFLTCSQGEYLGECVFTGLTPFSPRK